MDKKYINFFKDTYVQECIKNDSFLELYEIFNFDYSYLDTKDLTDILYSCGIKVLDYVYRVPSHFLYGAINPNKYGNLLIGEDFYIQEGITEIGYSAFKWCRKIKRFYLPSTLKLIEGYGLYGIEVEEIHYDGTKKEWDQNVLKMSDWANSNKLKRIIFNDGEVMELQQ